MSASTRQKKKVEKVMHEFKHGELKSGGSGKKVKSRRQAVAIAMSESGQSRDDKSDDKSDDKKSSGRKKKSS
jgi:hypothetical protein